MLVRVTLACVSVFVTGTGRCKIAHIAGISGRHLAAPAPLTRRGGGQSNSLLCINVPPSRPPGPGSTVHHSAGDTRARSTPADHAAVRQQQHAA